MCKLCEIRVKDWNGSDPRCGFDSNGDFTDNNWNCATLINLRCLITDHDEEVYADDQYSGLIPLGASFVLLSWYKRRGGTEGAWIVDEGRIRPLKESDAVSCLEWYK